MNKKLLILLFLIMATPVFAEENEIYVPETPPSLEDVQPASTNDKVTFVDKFKNIFKKNKKKDIDITDQELLEAQECNVLKPETKPETNNSDSKKKKNIFKKSNKKVINNEDTNSMTKVDPYIQAIDTNQDENKVLTDTAYNAGISTNKIIEVDDCVKIALEKHPLIQVAMSNADIYKSKIAQAWANYFPTLSAGISYSRNDMQMSNFTVPMQEYSMFYVPNLSGNMLLFDFGKTKAQADLAKKTYESAKYSLQMSINNVIYSVKQAYYNLLFAQQQVKVYEDTVNDYKMHLEQAKAYYDIGTKAKIDVLTAEHNLGKAQLGLIQANNTLKVAYVQLSNAMGLPEYSDYEVVYNTPAKAYKVDVNEAVETAYETNPELLAAKKKADASELLIRASRRAFTPNVSGFASYSRGGKRVDTDYGYQFGAQLNYSTVNLMLLKKQVDEAKATYKKDLADYENVKQNIYFEVKQAYLNLVHAQESIGVAKLSMNQAKEQYDQASGRYKVGLGDAIELKDAETTYRNSQLDYYNTLLNYHVYAANLERLMGVPLEATDVELL